MDRQKIGNLILVLVLGLFIGAVSGVIIDKLTGRELLSVYLLKKPVILELYLIKVEIQLTPASLVGLVVTAYFSLKKG